MNEFTADIHGPDEEVGIYEAKVLYDYNDEQGQPEVIYLKAIVSQKLKSQQLEQGEVEIIYHLNTREFDPLNDIPEKIKPLYPSLIIMLEETLGASWGYEVN
ncbi:MAG: hypothetical protein QM791_23725 [Ferruginibacter sp.]